MTMPRKLQSIGLIIFIKYYEIALKAKDKNKLISLFIKDGISNDAGASIRANAFIKVINNKNECRTCLEYILKFSVRSDEEQKTKLKYI